MTPPSTDRSRLFIFASLLLGVFTFVIVLLFHNLADGDLWAKLSLGAAVWNHGKLPSTDVFAFTPVLPVYVDHEWGSGLIFFTMLKWFGPSSLMWLKVFLAFTALACAFAIAARAKVSWPVLLALALPCAFCVLPGYVPVIRSHAFTYALFALTLLLLELIRGGRRWPAFALVPVMVLWVNVHGGFVAGLGTIGVYAAVSVIERKGRTILLSAFAACALATLVNPYGYKYWGYVLPAVFHKRPDIAEWQPMPWWGVDSFLGFRILFVLTIVALILGRRTTVRSWASGSRAELKNPATTPMTRSPRESKIGVDQMPAIPTRSATVRRCSVRQSVSSSPTTLFEPSTAVLNVPAAASMATSSQAAASSIGIRGPAPRRST